MCLCWHLSDSRGQTLKINLRWFWIFFSHQAKCSLTAGQLSLNSCFALIWYSISDSRLIVLVTIRFSCLINKLLITLQSSFSDVSDNEKHHTKRSTGWNPVWCLELTDLSSNESFAPAPRVVQKFKGIIKIINRDTCALMYSFVWPLSWYFVYCNKR